MELGITITHKMKLEEALRRERFSYTGTRKEYEVHDSNPSVLILDDDYNVDGNGRSILGFNLNYLEDLSPVEKRSLVNRINAKDNRVLNIRGVRSWLRMAFNKGDYDRLTVEQKKERYKRIVEDHPELKKVIRRYKYTGIEGRS